MDNAITLMTSNGLHILVPTESLFGPHEISINGAENAASVYMLLGRG